MRSDRARLEDIALAIAAIRRQVGTSRARFDEDELIQVWVIHHLQIIGEAAAKLSSSTKARSTAPWTAIIGMRNVLAHQYFGIDRDVVWNVVERELHGLAAEVERLLGLPEP